MEIDKLHTVRLFPKLSEREPWEALKRQPRLELFRSKVREHAEKALSEPIIELSATRFMDYVRNGNRDRYEKDYFARRTSLEQLVLAEAFEYQGRYTDRIIDFLWAILNEPTWCIPAHTGVAGAVADALPDFELERIDLFSAETSMVVAQTLMLMEEELNAVSPNLVRRVRRILKERAILPITKGVPFWWLCGNGNWSVWICSNLLNASAAVLEDAEFTSYAKILLPTVENYIRTYLEDGACDEGASYWNVSPARLLVFLETLYLASDRKLSCYDDPKIRKMGEFIADLWIDGDCFVPFADAGVHSPLLQCGVVSRYAERIGSEKLRDFVLRFRSETPAVSSVHSAFICSLAELFWMPEKVTLPAERPDFAAWYECYQGMFVRNGRIFLAAKGGNNGEHHNHNDVGEFVIAVDGTPLVIDLGRSEYTRFTFSERRYENFILNSFGHNVCSFNGVGQLAGAEHRAENVRYEPFPGGVRLSMELAGCYPPELGLKHYTRRIEFLFGKGISVADAWSSERPLEAQLPLYTAVEIVDGSVGGKLKFVSSAPYECRRFEVTDCQMLAGWGAHLWKTLFSLPVAAAGEMNLYFELEER